MIPVSFCNFKKSPKSTKIPYLGETIFNFTTTQEGEGIPSPTNVRPILPGFSFERDDNTIVNIYGGSLDVTSGVLTVTKKGYIVDGSETYTFSTDRVYFYPPDIAIPETSTADLLKCSHFKPCAQGVEFNDTDNAICKTRSNQAVMFKSSTYTTSTATFIAYARSQISAGTPITIVYELAQPVTMQLSATELQRFCEQLQVPYPVYPVEHTTFQCELIEDTSIINPSIKLKCAFSQISDKNYCYIAEFSRYYFITNIVYRLGLWEISLSEDTLGTNKTEIGASSQYITRSASDYDESIIDTAYETNVELVYNYRQENNARGIFCESTETWYVVGIIGGVTGIAPEIRSKVYNGSVVYYCMQQTRFDALMDELLSADDFNTNFNIPSGEISEPLAKQLINPLQYIHSITVIPFAPQEKIPAAYIQLGFNILPITTNDIYIMGAFELQLPNIANGFIHEYLTSIEVPVHPDYHTKGKWVLSDPISRYVLRIPIWGSIEIPCNIVQSQATIYTSGNDTVFKVEIRTLYDMSTGRCTLRCSVNGRQTWFYEETKNLSVNVPFHQAIQNAQGFEQAQLQMASSGINAVGGFLGDIGSLNIGSAIKRFFGTAQATDALIDSAQNANAVHISGNGSQGALYSFHHSMTVPFVDCYFQRFVGEDRQNIGRPLMQKRTINTLSGYIQCKNANFSSSAFEEENNSIINYLNGGFFYE